MSADLDIKYFQQRISLLIYGLKSRYDELESRDFPSEVPSEIIALLKTILDLVSKRTGSADERILPLIFRLLCVYQELLSFIDNAHTEQTPSGLVSIIKDLLGKINTSAHFFPSPQARYNYSILDIQPFIIDPLSQLLSPSELSSLPTFSRSPIHLIMFPRSERDNVLNHAVFGHEVGHIFAKKYLDEEAAKPEYSTSLQSKTQETFGNANINPQSPQLAQLRVKATIHATLEKIRRRAMEELLSDYVGTLICGPSALFSAYELFSLDDLDAMPRDNSFYPPPRYRIRFILKVLQEENYLDNIKKLYSESSQNNENYFSGAMKLIELINSIASSNKDEELLSKDPFRSKAYEWVMESLDAAKAEVRTLIPADLIYTAKQYNEEIPALIERLALSVPPNELGTYPNIKLPSWQSALASAWLLKVNGERYNDNEAVKFSLDDYLLINKLCLKAVDSIALQRDYITYMTNS